MKIQSISQENSSVLEKNGKSLKEALIKKKEELTKKIGIHKRYSSALDNARYSTIADIDNILGRLEGPEREQTEELLGKLCLAAQFESGKGGLGKRIGRFLGFVKPAKKGDDGLMNGYMKSLGVLDSHSQVEFKDVLKQLNLENEMKLVDDISDKDALRFIDDKIRLKNRDHPSDKVLSQLFEGTSNTLIYNQTFDEKLESLQSNLQAAN